jgi:hypothetical protein
MVTQKEKRKTENCRRVEFLQLDWFDHNLVKKLRNYTRWSVSLTISKL